MFTLQEGAFNLASLKLGWRRSFGPYYTTSSEFFQTKFKFNSEELCDLLCQEVLNLI